MVSEPLASMPADAVDSNDAITSTKATLRAALSVNHGLTKHPDVLVSINALASLNPTPKPTRSSLMLGVWQNLSGPDFPNRIPPVAGEEDIFKYTLGRLPFNLFEPRDLVCTLESVRNPVELVQPVGEPGEAGTAYPFVIALTIHMPAGDLAAVMKNDGVGAAATDQRFSVVFNAGTLAPAESVVCDAQKMALWKQTFACAYARADEERSYFSSATRAAVHWMLQLTATTDAAATLQNISSFHFKMERSPRGYLDVLFLDDELRITKGNRGSFVVVERVLE